MKLQKLLANVSNNQKKQKRNDYLNMIRGMALNSQQQLGQMPPILE
jgi:hypothetical protein